MTDPPAARRRLGALGQELDSAIGLLASLRSRADVLTDELLLPPVVTIAGLREIVGLTTAIEDRPRKVPPTWLQVETLDEVEQRIQQLVSDTGHHHQRSEALRTLAGSTCESLGQAPAVEIRTTIAALEDARPPITLAPEVNVSTIATVVSFLERLQQASTEIDELSVSVARGLGVRSEALTPNNAQALATAGQLSASPHLPEANWFDGQTLGAARDAVLVLQPLVEQYKQLGDAISQTLTADVAAFDVETLYDGPSDLSPNLSRLSSKGRENRRQLKACVVGEKITDEVKAVLPSVRQWKRVDGELQAVEQQRASLLGTHYYRRAQTDFAATTAALDVATSAITLVSEEADRLALSQRLSRTGAMDRALAAKGERLQADLARWRSELQRHLPSSAEFDGLSFEQTREWAVNRLAEVRRLSDALGQVRAVAPLDDLGSLRNVAELRAANAAVEVAIEGRRSADHVLLGPAYDGLATDWPAVEQALDWVKRVRAIHQGPFGERPAEAMCTALINPAGIEEDTERYQKYIDSVLDLFNPQQRGVLAADLESLDDATSTLDELRQTTGQIDVWATYVESRAQLVTAGLGEVVEFCEENTREGVFVPRIIDRAVLTAWVDAVLADDRRCDPLLAEQRDRLVAEYRDLDRQLIAHASGRVIESCNARRPRQSVGEPAIIQREATKKTRHRPIRTLLEEAGRAAQSLMPCFMMSPLSVSQFLPPSLRFDVVIFDEASQVRPCDAVNSIYRGSQLIVAGDDRQLPPTSFFDRSDNNTDDEYDEDDLEVFESILDLCKGAARVPALPLLWHYRSRHESLITYSNRAFYEGKLVTYPGAIEEAPDLGIELIHVPEGVYQRGGARDNPIEAKRVVERVIAHAENHPDLTVGVVAFSEAQATRIAQELEAVQRQRSDLDTYFRENRLNGFFIKNLENVQGDERDIIIFSIGYGRDEFGKFTLNFGPVNKEGGHRRLNVAITRARQRVEIVTSVLAGDFVGSSKSTGVEHLRRYLAFAERGPVALADTGTIADAEPESPFEESVLGVIRGWGYDAVPQVGQAGYRIDIGIRDPDVPGTFAIGVECDGAAYHSSKVARDRDRLRQEVLEGLGWRMHRIWGPAWYRNRREEQQRLRTAIDNAIAGDWDDAASTPAPGPIEIDLVEVTTDAPPDWAVTYEIAEVGVPRSAGPMHEPSERSRLQKLITDIVVQEGPISVELCMQRAREAWGVGRSGSRIREAFNAIVQNMLTRGVLEEDEDGFVQIPDQDLTNVRVPDPDDDRTIRKAAQIPLQELELAIRLLVEASHSITEEDLKVHAARLFGWNRTGAGISAAFGDALAGLFDEGILERDRNGRIQFKERARVTIAGEDELDGGN